MADIETREDLAALVECFYKKLLSDHSISYLFTDVARINLPEHLPVLVDFWDMILFQADTYRKNVMQLHLALHAQSPLSDHHFETWLSYFKQTVDELFAGDKAELAKQRALSIATMMKIKMAQQTSTGTA
ncbi:group III truncated hemoglobin [Segetibacter sp. 3557_3]|uniref:group III truncated hemoglobin n=1 Tax=Segetibacter sp. 3557_3 TaxID=2547429 RepID=UPI001058FF35|nr:group III truncated hemoglobin [Segetibacter sp. 3557_3]TDH25214.1 group III truncated hemoglobin [Segetibacter sp. 3557_3]